jgi:hypothetical protein
MASKDNIVRISSDCIHQQLETFHDLLDGCLTHLEESVPGDPIHIGASVAVSGMGGVWFTDDDQALLWHVPFQKRSNMK